MDLETQIGIARQHTIGDLLRRSAQKTPDKTAIICGDVSWTYGEFDALVNALARGLIARGVGQGDRVAMVSRNSHAFGAMRFAIARAGAVLVPVNFMLNDEEVGFILSSSGAKVLCYGPEFADLCAKARTHGTAVEWTVALPGENLPAAAGSDVPFDKLPDPDDSPVLLGLKGDSLAQIVYTSGTESAPKGAMLSHDAVMWQYVSCIVDTEMTRSESMLHALPLYHCAQLDVFFGPAVYLGMTSVITGQPSPDVILPLLEKHKISTFFCPPSVWISLLRSPLFDQTDLSALTKGYYGASIMPVEVLKELQSRLPQVRLWNLYGQTEIAPVATLLPPEEQLTKAGSAGFPALNVETRVVDDDMNNVAVGEVGEIVHRSPHLMDGYYNDPEKTAAAFAGGWFHSGDLATVDDDGYITVVDRKKDMINTGGENVSSREVEETIYLMPQVSEVAVIGLPHERWIEQVTAVIVLKEGESADAGQIMDHCREHLAHFKVPKQVEFIGALPKNPSGKILKRDLRITFGSTGSALG